MELYGTATLSNLGLARALEEEDKLIEAGFEFVRFNNQENLAVYRKRK